MKIQSLLATALLVASVGFANANSFAKLTGVEGLKLQVAGGYAHMTANPTLKNDAGAYENVTSSGVNLVVKPTIDLVSTNFETISLGATLEYVATSSKTITYPTYKVDYPGNSFYVAPLARYSAKVAPSTELYVEGGAGLSLGSVTVSEKTSSSTTTTSNSGTVTTSSYTTATNLNGYKSNFGFHITAGVEYGNVTVDATFKTGLSVVKPDFKTNFKSIQVGYRF